MTDGHEPSPDGLPWITLYRVPLCLAGLSIILITVSISIFIKSYQPSSPITFDSDQAIASSSSRITQSIVVDIEGAVVRPGVYRLPAGSRVEDILVLAGGFSRDADDSLAAKSINRAAFLVDGSKLYVPSVDSVAGAQSEQSSASRDGIVGQGTININTASQGELESLPGVGPVTAGKIINGRPYLTLDELLERKVLGAGVFEKVKESISL